MNFINRLTRLPLALCALLLAAGALPAQAQIQRAFGARYADDVRGDIVLTGNTVVRPASTTATGNGNTPGAYTDVDGVTLSPNNSSSAQIKLPAGLTGANILFARLYWQGRVATSVTAANTPTQTIRFSATGTSGGYQTYSATTNTPSAALSQLVYFTPSLNITSRAYSAYVDVTTQMKTAGATPTLLAGGLSADPSFNDALGPFAGWSVVVAYRQPGSTLRQLRVFDGLGIVNSGGGTVSTVLSGFRTPDSGNFVLRLGAVAFEGDSDVTGDALRFNGVALSDTANPATNFFNSTVSEDGLLFNTELNPPPRGGSVFGLDVDRTSFTGASTLIGAAAESATLDFTTTGDSYFTAAFTTSIPTFEIKGRVFEDPNFGGGAGRAFDANQNMAGAAGARVELYNTATGAYINAATTDSLGFYYFYNVGAGNFSVRVVNSTVRSNRTGSTAALVPVQTYRVDATGNVNSLGSGTPAPITNRVGGEVPSAVDPAASTTTLPAGSQSVARVTLGDEAVAGVDFGFNFDTVVNTNNAGQGSLRQFILNSNALGGTLNQQGLTANAETSIFQIPSTDPRYSASGPARIVLATPLDAIAGANANNTIVDGATQTANIGNTNTANLGLSNTVGTGSRSVAPVSGPEIEVAGNGAINRLFLIGAASNVTLRNLALTGQNGSASPSNNLAAVAIDGATNPTVTGNVFGATTTTAGVVGATARVSDGVAFGAATTTGATLTGNLFSQIGRRAILAGAYLSTTTINGLLIEGNQFLTTGAQMGGNQSDGEGIILFGGFQSTIVRGNLFDGIAKGSAASGDNAIEVTFTQPNSATGGLTIEDNTIRNGRGVGISMADTTANGSGTGTNTAGKTISVTRNVIQNQAIVGTSGGTGLEVRSAQNVRISRNSFFDNDTLAIDLGAAYGGGAGKGVSANDGAKGLAANAGNLGMDYPIFTRVEQVGGGLRVSGYIGNVTSGSATWAGAQIEIYEADNDPANQNGEVILGDGQNVGHGEGVTYLTTITANGSGSGLFDATISGLTLGGRQLTAIAIDGSGNTSEFNNNSGLINPVAPTTVSGTVYLDANRNGTLDGAESGIGVNGLFVKAVLQGGATAAQAVAVDAATGAFQFSGLATGNYTLVLDDNATLTDIAPAIPAGYVGTQAPDGTRQFTLGNQPVIQQDFGLYAGAQISGNVFEDNGIGGGTANDGVRNGGEVGLAGVGLNLTNNTGTVIDTTTTDASGNFTFRVANSVATGALKVVEVNLTDYVSTGASVGNTNGSYSRATDTITFNYTAGATYTGLNFGDVRGATLISEDAKTGTIGSSVSYTHVFRAQTAGSVVFSVSQLPSPANPDWSVVTFRDTNGNGQLDGADAQIGTAPIAVVAGQEITVFLKNFVPTTAANGAQDKLTITATFTASGSNAPPVQVLSRQDLTTVAANQGLLLSKTVDKATARSGDVLLYTITYRNTGADVLTNLVVNDATPAYTTFVSAADGARPPGLTGVTIAAPSVGGKGAVKWTFVGGLNPGGSGTVTFRVRVD